MISDGGRFMVERCWGAEKTLDGARMKAESRIAELETEVEELIDLGNKLSYVVYETQHEKLAKKWTMLVSKK